jgi:hypothetical protein
MRSFVFYTPQQIFFRRPNQGGWMRCVSHMACVGEKRVAHRFSVGKPQGRRPLRRPDNICKTSCKMDLREIGWECVTWIYVAQYGNTAAVRNTVMNPRVPKVRGLGEEPFPSREELCPLELVAFRLSGDYLELDIGLTKCDSVLVNSFHFHFDFS